MKKIIITLAAAMLLAFTGQAQTAFFGPNLSVLTHTATNSDFLSVGTLNTPTGYGTIYHGALATTNDIQFYALIQLSSTNTITINGTNYLLVYTWNPAKTNATTETISPGSSFIAPTVNLIAGFTNTTSGTIQVNGSYNGTIN